MILADAHELFIRQKGRRFAYAVPYLAIHDLGAKLYAMEQRRLKSQARKGTR